MSFLVKFRIKSKKSQKNFKKVRKTLVKGQEKVRKSQEKFLSLTCGNPENVVFLLKRASCVKHFAFEATDADPCSRSKQIKLS